MPVSGRACAIGGVFTAMLGCVAGIGLDPVTASAASSCSNSFTVVPSTNPGNGGNNLLAVAAISASNVWAVGDQAVTVAGMTQTETLIEHWDGTSWSTIPGPNTGSNPLLPTTLGRLDGVSGSSASDVWAVGDAGLIEHWNGSSWSVVAAASGTGQLRAVWADSPTDAWAVGTQTSGSTTVGLTEHWNGSTWQIVAGQDSSIPSGWTSVSGSAASDVWAYGISQQAPLVVEHWNGTSWTSAPPTSYNPTGPGAISAGGIADIGAGGTFLSVGQQAILGNSPGGAQFQKWNGSAWNAIGSFAAPVASSWTMSATSASAANDVWFAGSANRQDPAHGYGTQLPAEPFAAHFDGNQVTEVSNVNPTNQGQYNGVAAIPGQAWAVGYSVDPSTGNDSTLIETVCLGSPGNGVPEAPSGALLGVAGLMGCAVAYRVLGRRSGRTAMAQA